MAREPRTLAEQLVARAALVARPDPRRKAGLGDLRAGFRLAGSVGEFVVLWAYYARQEGRALTVTDFIRASGESDRTVWRWLADFRRLFPELGEHATPQVLVDHLPTRTRDLVGLPPLDLDAIART